MAQEIFSFFDSTVNDERSYTEREMALALGTVAANGVRTLDDLQVTTAQLGLQVQVGVGRAMVEGYNYTLLDDGGEPLLLAHEAALTQPRIDRVVLQLDKSTDAKSIHVVVKQGVAAASPMPPELTRTDTVYELSLAQVHVAVGAGVLRPEDIVDERAEEAVCGTLDAVLRLAQDAREVADAAQASADAAQETAQAVTDQYTAADVLEKLKTVDGDGSGLDADLLDGQHGSYFATAGGMQALQTDGAVNVYAHTKTGTVHDFVGSGVNGRALITAPVEPGDTFSVNGVACNAYIGTDALDELPVGHWMTFVYDGSKLDFKGGGAGLAVRVVGGTTQPGNPRENTVWVNTATAIGAVRWQANQPSNPQAGDVWLVTQATGVVGMEVAKKPVIMYVYPGACLQYVGGAWQLKSAKAYAGGAWYELAAVIYDHGVFGTNKVTAFNVKVTGSAWIDQQATQVYLYAPASGSSGVTAYTFTPVDLTNYTVLEMQVYFKGWSGYYGAQKTPGDANGAPTYFNVYGGKYLGNTEMSGTFKVDITALTGNYHLAAATSGSVTGGYIGTGYIYAIKLY